jgi:uncharacterized protein YggE
MRDAKHRGELLAGEAGVVLGAPLKIVEQQGPGMPVFYAEPMTAAAPARAAAMPVAPGEQELLVTISVVYELKPPKS